MIERDDLHAGEETGLLPHAVSAAAPRNGPSVQAFHAGRQYLETRFGRIAYVEHGEGPAAFFLHGWPLNGYHWRDAMALLSNVRRCIAVDFMGLGYTEVPADRDLSPVSQMETSIPIARRSR